MQEMQALEPRKKSGVSKRCPRLSQERDQGLARDAGTSTKKEIRGSQKTQALEPRKRPGVGKRRSRHLNQEIHQGLAKDVGT